MKADSKVLHSFLHGAWPKSTSFLECRDCWDDWHCKTWAGVGATLKATVLRYKH
jgi:hypothetical protein